MEAALRAIAEPRRRQILQLVWDRERSAGEIASHFEVTRPAVSQHLKILKAAGLVSEEARGTRRIYRLDAAGVAALRQQLDDFWDRALGGFRHVVERSKRGRK